MCIRDRVQSQSCWSYSRLSPQADQTAESNVVVPSLECALSNGLRRNQMIKLRDRSVPKRKNIVRKNKKLIVCFTEQATLGHHCLTKLQSRLTPLPLEIDPTLNFAVSIHDL